ncbi:potassium channel family protein [Mycoplasmopsis citelli]|uniref:potassium channel family protein n=1 Tax=Mycoplasmopsis citelli TaxID=171281 RepID=UPI0021153627|nr:potassium channel family protein [Mycoplasmopsis citelli]UUD36379.1 potassium channel family protein [Mycoplasmopsis citelli]
MFESIKKTPHKLLRLINQIVWINQDLSDDALFKVSKIQKLKFSYALIIIFACLISFANLFVPSGQQSSTVAKVFISIAQVPVFFIFVADFTLHLITYHFQNKEKNLFKLYLKFLLSYYSIVAILCILASINLISVFANINAINQKVLDFFNGLGLVRILRLLIVLQIFAPFAIIFKVFKDQSKVLLNIFVLVIVLIVLFALVIWNAEVSHHNSQVNAFIQNYASTHNLSFDIAKTKALNDPKYPQIPSNSVSNFGDAIYFTTITLTTIGYGDFSPQSSTAKIIVIIVSLVGIAVIAIPSGVIAGSFLQQIQNKLTNNTNKENKND